MRTSQPMKPDEIRDALTIRRETDLATLSQLVEAFGQDHEHTTHARFLCDQIDGALELVEAYLSAKAARRAATA